MDTLGSWIDSEELTGLLEKLGHRKPSSTGEDTPPMAAEPATGSPASPGPLPPSPSAQPTAGSLSAPAAESPSPPVYQAFPSHAIISGAAASDSTGSGDPAAPPQPQQASSSPEGNAPDPLEVSVANLVHALSKLGIDMDESPSPEPPQAAPPEPALENDRVAGPAGTLPQSPSAAAMQAPELSSAGEAPAEDEDDLEMSDLDEGIPMVPANARLGEKLARIRAKAEREGLLRKNRFSASKAAPGTGEAKAFRTSSPQVPLESSSTVSGTPADANPPAPAPGPEATQKSSPAQQDSSGISIQPSLSTPEARPADSGLSAFLAPQSPMIPRLEAFQGWILRELDCSDLIVLDPGGNKVLTSRTPQSGSYCRIALALAESHKRISRITQRTDTCVECRLEDGLRISVIVVQSTYGQFTVAIAGAESLPASTTRQIREGLVSALDGAS